MTPPLDPQLGAADGGDGGAPAASGVSSKSASAAASADSKQQLEDTAQPPDSTVDIPVRVPRPEEEHGWAADPVAAGIVADVAAREHKAERSLMHRYNTGAVSRCRIRFV